MNVKRGNNLSLRGQEGECIAWLCIVGLENKVWLFLSPTLGKSFLGQQQTCQVSLIRNLFKGKLFVFFFSFRLDKVSDAEEYHNVIQTRQLSFQSFNNILKLAELWLENKAFSVKKKKARVKQICTKCGNKIIVSETLKCLQIGGIFVCF